MKRTDFIERAVISLLANPKVVGDDFPDGRLNYTDIREVAEQMWYEMSGEEWDGPVVLETSNDTLICKLKAHELPK